MTPSDLGSRIQKARELLADHPPATADAAEAFLRGGDSGALDRLLDGVMTHFLPPKPDRPPLSSLPPSARLVEDLGFDSLAMVEMSFFLQDLMDVKLADEDLRALQTLGDLRTLVAKHATAQPA